MAYAEDEPEEEQPRKIRAKTGAEGVQLSGPAPSQLTSEDGNKPKIWVETPAKRSVKRGMLHFMLVQPMSGRVESKENFSSFEQRFDCWAQLSAPPYMEKNKLLLSSTHNLRYS